MNYSNIVMQKHTLLTMARAHKAKQSELAGSAKSEKDMALKRLMNNLAAAEGEAAQVYQFAAEDIEKRRRDFEEAEREANLAIAQMNNGR